MNDELQKQLAAYMQTIAAAAGDGTSFVLAQAPLVVQEKILFARIENAVFLVLFGCGAIWFARHMRVFHAQTKKSESSYDVYFEKRGGLASIGCGAASAVCVLLGAMCLSEGLKAWFAPRLFIVEWALSFLQH